MPGKKNLFRCVVVPKPVDKHSYVDFPRSVEQRYEVTKSEAKSWCKNAIGKPIQAGHIDNVVIGTVKNSFTNENGTWFVDILLNDDLAGLKAESDIRKGEVNCVSLAHYPATGEVKEVSLVNIPAREGSVILGDIVQASKGNQTITNLDSYIKLLTIQEIDYSTYDSVYGKDLTSSDLVMASLPSAATNPLMSQAAVPVDNMQLNSQPSLQAYTAAMAGKMSIDELGNAIKFLEQQIKQHQQVQQQQQQIQQQQQQAPALTVASAGVADPSQQPLGNSFPATAIQFNNPASIFPSSSGPLGNIINTYNSMLQSAEASRPKNGGYSLVGATPVPNSFISNGMSMLNTSANISNQQQQQPNVSAMPTSVESSSTRAPVTMQQQQQQQQGSDTTNNPNASAATGKPTGTRRPYILPAHPPVTATEQEFNEWKADCYAKASDYVAHSDASHEAKSEMLINAKKHIESAIERYDLAKKNSELIKQKDDLNKYNLNMKIDQLKNNKNINQEELNKIQKQYESNEISYDTAKQFVDQVESKFAHTSSSPMNNMNFSHQPHNSYQNSFMHQNGFVPVPPNEVAIKAALAEMQQIAMKTQQQQQQIEQAALQIQKAQQDQLQSHKDALWQLVNGPSMRPNPITSTTTTTSSSSSSSSSLSGLAQAQPILASSGSMYNNGNTYNQLTNGYTMPAQMQTGFMHKVYNSYDPVDNANKIAMYSDANLIKASAASYPGIPQSYSTPYNHANGCPIPFKNNLPWEATGAHPEAAYHLNVADQSFVSMNKSSMSYPGSKFNTASESRFIS